MVEAGVFHPEARFELIDGEIIDGRSEIFLDYHFYWIAIEVKRKMPSGTIVQIL
jgi:hypothetical protein